MNPSSSPVPIEAFPDLADLRVALLLPGAARRGLTCLGAVPRLAQPRPGAVDRSPGSPRGTGAVRILRLK